MFLVVLSASLNVNLQASGSNYSPVRSENGIDLIFFEGLPLPYRTDEAGAKWIDNAITDLDACESHLENSGEADLQVELDMVSAELKRKNRREKGLIGSSAGILIGGALWGAFGIDSTVGKIGMGLAGVSAGALVLTFAI